MKIINKIEKWIKEKQKDFEFMNEFEKNIKKIAKASVGALLSLIVVYFSTDNIYFYMFALDIWILTLLYVLGWYAIEKEHNETWNGAISMEWKKSEKISEDWEKRYPAWDFLQSVHYEIDRKLEIPKKTYNDIKYFIQRGKRGYSDRDVWALDYYISNVMKHALKDLKEQVHGIPCDMANTQTISLDENSKEILLWKDIIENIRWMFEVNININDCHWIYVENEKDRKKLQKYVKKLNRKDKKRSSIFKDIDPPHYHLMTIKECDRYKKAWGYFQKYYHNLWD